MPRPFLYCLVRISESKDGGSSCLEEDFIIALQKKGFHGATLERTQEALGWLTKCLQPQGVETSPRYRQQTWKEMTRTTINKSCKQFNKMCFCYPTINTN